MHEARIACWRKALSIMQSEMQELSPDVMFRPGVHFKDLWQRKQILQSINHIEYTGNQDYPIEITIASKPVNNTAAQIDKTWEMWKFLKMKQKDTCYEFLSLSQRFFGFWVHYNSWYDRVSFMRQKGVCSQGIPVLKLYPLRLRHP